MLAVLCVVWLTAAAAHAQVAGNAATLRVTVVDPSGAVIVGARVRVADASADTGARGDAVFAALEPGR